jgi:hypothetical protein
VAGDGDGDGAGVRRLGSARRWCVLVLAFSLVSSCVSLLAAPTFPRRNRRLQDERGLHQSPPARNPRRFVTDDEERHAAGAPLRVRVDAGRHVSRSPVRCSCRLEALVCATAPRALTPDEQQVCAENDRGPLVTAGLWKGHRPARRSRADGRSGQRRVSLARSQPQWAETSGKCGRRPDVRRPEIPVNKPKFRAGGRLDRTQEVGGSSPPSSTSKPRQMPGLRVLAAGRRPVTLITRTPRSPQT